MWIFRPGTADTGQSLTAGGLRLMQKEFDDWFYRDPKVGDLPNLTLSHVRHDLAGLRFVRNAWSLLTGDRKGFKPESVACLIDGLEFESPEKEAE
ncbi:MAG: hypothetical protein OXC19_25660 [Bryobacterales bacterium]|nr:hypothetical protein [Bryobacterales bacterium]